MRCLLPPPHLLPSCGLMLQEERCQPVAPHRLGVGGHHRIFDPGLPPQLSLWQQRAAGAISAGRASAQVSLGSHGEGWRGEGALRGRAQQGPRVADP